MSLCSLSHIVSRAAGVLSYGLALLVTQATHPHTAHTASPAAVRSASRGDRVAAAPAARGDSATARADAPAPEIDGRLDDAAWQSAVWTSGFVQKDPAEGAPAQTPTEVAFMYDEEALYVAARMTSLGPDDIDALVSRRDNSGRSERIDFSFDS